MLCNSIIIIGVIYIVIYHIFVTLYEYMILYCILSLNKNRKTKLNKKEKEKNKRRN